MFGLVSVTKFSLQNKCQFHQSIVRKKLAKTKGTKKRKLGKFVFHFLMQRNSMNIIKKSQKEEILKTHAFFDSLKMRVSDQFMDQR